MIRTISMLALAAGLGVSITAKMATADPFPNYHLLQTIAVPSSGADWDYLNFDPATGRLFVGHRQDGVEVFDTKDGFKMTKIADTTPSDGVELMPDFGLGAAYVETGSLTIFKLSDLSVVKQINVGDELDSAIYDPVTHRLLPVNANETADGKGQTLTAYSVPDFQPVGSVAVPEVDLEHSVADGQGNIYFAAQSSNGIMRLNMRTLKITADYPTVGCVQPTGLAFDPDSHRLFIGCRGHVKAPVFIVMNSDTGDVVFNAPISPDNDGVAFDPKNKDIFLTTGIGSFMFIFHEESPDQYKMVEAIATQTNEHTLALDVDGNRIYTDAAEGLTDPNHKIKIKNSPYYPNTFEPNTFNIQVFGQ